VSKVKALLPMLPMALVLAPSHCIAAHDPHPGDEVPDFAFADFSGVDHHLSDFAGKYVLLDFWATWCQPCLKETPDLIRAGQQFESRGLVILGMNSDKKQEAPQRFIRESDVPWQQSSAESTEWIIHHVLKVKWYPTLILLGPDRRILAVSVGEKGSLYGPALAGTLDQILPPGLP